MDVPRPRGGPRPLALLVALPLLAACASIDVSRRTQTSGTFVSRGIALTIFSMDIPKTADQVARENASDTNLANMQVTDVLVFPYFGPLDWLLDIVGIRYCRIEGTWGDPGPAGAAKNADH